MANIVTLILAGGQGSRLYPLTEVRSKPAVPIGGRFRLIDIPISNCIHSNLRKIFVLTQFASESLHRHIFTTYRFDQFHQKDFVTILSAQLTLENRDWYQGTADAVRRNLHFIGNNTDLVLVLSGDHLYRMDYRKFIDFHLESGADITIGVTPVERAKVGSYGVMKVNGDGRITDFREKPTNGPDIDNMNVPQETFRSFGIDPAGRTHLASMGIYVFHYDVLKELLLADKADDFGKEVIPRAISKKSIFAHFFDGYWEDIGTIKSFFKAHMELCGPLPRFNFYDEERPIFTHARFLPGSKVSSAVIENSIMCEGSIIERSTIRSSIIGIRSRIGRNSLLENAVVMGADFFETMADWSRNASDGIPDVGIGSDCEIRKAIIDKNARIGNRVKLINARGLRSETTAKYSIVDGIIVVPKNAVIPDGTVI